MSNLEDVLREMTFKRDPDVGRRVFYTLAGDEPDEAVRRRMQAFRNTKLLSRLVVALHEKGILNEGQIDEMLLAAALGAD